MKFAHKYYIEITLIITRDNSKNENNIDVLQEKNSN